MNRDDALKGYHFEQLLEMFDFPGEFLPLTKSMPLEQRFRNIKANYKRHQAMVDAGLSEWFDSDPYEVGQWCSIFTPIESAMWQDIRCYSLDLWPQLPVGRYFVDFGNPVAKVAIECDGREFHQDKVKDAARDRDLERHGWRVFRVPGWQCNARILDSDDAERRGVEDRHAWNEERTPYRALMDAKEMLDGPRDCARMVRAARQSAWLEGIRLAPRAGNGAGAPGHLRGTAGTFGG